MKKNNKFFQIIANRPKMVALAVLFVVAIVEAILFFDKFLICFGVTLILFAATILFYKFLVWFLSLHFSVKKYFLSKPIRKVSAVVPNYNYAKYLKERVESIISQTYPIYELIILDDASSDNSVEVIEKIVKDLKIRRPDLKVRFVPNEKNSGSVFKQWEKAFDESAGDFVWICEADDSCSKYFLNSVMRAFKDEEVVLSYAESRAIDDRDEELMSNLRPWVDEFKTGHWNKNYINDGKGELKEFLCCNNTIPNASGVVFRKINAPIKNYLREAQKFSLVGDWRFYAKYLLNGKIAYSAESLNYRRMQDSGVTSKTDKYKQYLEIVEVQNSIEKDIKISQDAKKKIQDYRKVVMASFGLSEEEFEYMKIPFDKILRESKIEDEVLLSVVVSAYNASEYIDACLASVKNALPEKSEIIVVDDGSTDGTLGMIKKCQKDCPEMKYYTKKNGGLASVKNFGLSKARGRYVIFMDADDKIKLDGYQVMLKKALENDADIVVCDMALIYDRKTINCHVHHKEPGGLLGFLIDGLMASSNNKMVKRNLYDKAGNYPEGKNNEDVAVTPVLMALSKNTQYVPSSFYEYYQREGSIQNSEFSEKRLMIFDTVKQAYLAIQKILPKEAEDILEIMAGNQLLALLIHVICNIENDTKRNKIIREFCEKYRVLNIPNNGYVEKYCDEFELPKLPQYILEASPQKIYTYVKNGDRIDNFLDYIGRVFGIKRLMKKRPTK